MYKRQTLVLVTHDPELAAYCDRILELDDGRLRGEKHNDERLRGENHNAEAR